MKKHRVKLKYQALRDQLEDLEDLLDLRNAKEAEGNAPAVMLEQFKQTL